MNCLGPLLELSALLPGVVLGCLPVRSHLRSPRLKCSQAMSRTW